MIKKIQTEKELGEALKNGEETIEITGDLLKKTIKLRATGNVAWAIAFAAIGIAVYATIAAIPTAAVTAGTGALPLGTAGLIAAPIAAGLLGGSTTLSAILIAVAAGGVGVLTRLRGYKEISRTKNSLILKRK